MLEWLKRHAWKACNRQKRFGGSNPPLSANRGKGSHQHGFLFCLFLTGSNTIIINTKGRGAIGTISGPHLIYLLVY